MLVVDEIIKLFGLSPQDKSLDEYLTNLNIVERPEFDENPEEWVLNREDGFILMFRAKHGYESLYGPTDAIGNMIFKEIRLYGPQNTGNFRPYQGKLPYGLNFEKNLEEIRQILGNPDFEDEPNTPERVLVWNNFKGTEIGMVLTSDETHMSYFSIRPVRRKHRL